MKINGNVFGEFYCTRRFHSWDPQNMRTKHKYISDGIWNINSNQSTKHHERENNWFICIPLNFKRKYVRLSTASYMIIILRLSTYAEKNCESQNKKLLQFCTWRILKKIPFLSISKFIWISDSKLQNHYPLKKKKRKKNSELSTHMQTCHVLRSYKLHVINSVDVWVFGCMIHKLSYSLMTTVIVQLCRCGNKRELSFQLAMQRCLFAFQHIRMWACVVYFLLNVYIYRKIYIFNVVV